MKNLLYLAVAGMFAIVLLQHSTKDSMAAMQANMTAQGAAWKVKVDRKKGGCVFDRHDGINVRICG
ncbi:hypothetical protein LCGC14_0534190 [marine sediment metagenome]|uniref:Uncharacterized protein n=1 Tax=marine sediment metagenome TaxID=412755 RepID=A0A0F9RUT2_9ZZZZ